MTYEIIVGKENHNTKPKLFLKKKLDLPFYILFKFIKEKRITLNGKKIKQDSVLKEGDIIKVWKDEIKLRTNDTEVENIHPKNLNIETIKETADFLVLNKLPGVVVQGAQDNDLSLSYHLSYLKKKNNDTNFGNYFHAHRIDKQTSGTLLCAKHARSLKDLNTLFRERNIKKTYLCLCVGTFEKQQEDIEILMKRNEEGVKQKVGVVRKKDHDSKPTISSYKVLEQYEFQDEVFSLVEVSIKTGFMHQIRVLMKHLGHPIAGDTMYGNSFVNKMIKDILPRQFLHASTLEFNLYGKEYKVEAPFTDDLKKCIESMKKL